MTPFSVWPRIGPTYVQVTSCAGPTPPPQSGLIPCHRKKFFDATYRPCHQQRQTARQERRAISQPLPVDHPNIHQTAPDRRPSFALQEEEAPFLPGIPSPKDSPRPEDITKTGIDQRQPESRRASPEHPQSIPMPLRSRHRRHSPTAGQSLLLYGRSNKKAPAYAEA